MFSIVLPWKNPRWIIAFVAILMLDAAIVFGVVRFAQVKPSTVIACIAILTDVGILVWFRQSAFRNRRALSDVLMLYLGGGIVLVGCWILYEHSETVIALFLMLVVVLSQRIWGRTLLKKLQAEYEKEK